MLLYFDSKQDDLLMIIHNPAVITELITVLDAVSHSRTTISSHGPVCQNNELHLQEYALMSLQGGLYVQSSAEVERNVS